MFLTCMALFFGVLHAAAQSQPNVQPDASVAGASGELRDKPEGFIKLNVMVNDATGKPVPGFTANDFRLYENGREQKILSFQAFTGRGAGSEPPVKVILLLDTLDVPRELARDERNAVMFYLRKSEGQLARPTSVLLFSEDGLWKIPKSSTDGNALAQEIEQNKLTLVRRNLPKPGSHVTSGYIVDPIEYELKALGQIATDERREPGRKLLIWVGPGEDIRTGGIGGARIHTDLFGTICWFSTLLREAQVTLYSFSVGETDPRAHLYEEHLGGASSNRADIMSLNRKVLAVQSGGRVIDPGLDIEGEIEKCVGESGRFYRISFDPFAAEHPNEYHDLKVEIEKPGLSARTSTGYYDQPWYSTDQIPRLKRVSLDELQKILEVDESDAEKAHQLTGVELSARLTERRLASLYNVAHGKRTRQQLRILADASSFLNPPADEILAAPAPTSEERQHMISMASAYLASAINTLPDFFADRITTRYQETPRNLQAGVNYQPLHQTDSSTTTVRYRHGREESDARFHGLRFGNPELITYGVFGPALQDVFKAVEKSGSLTWIRWELETTGRAAVFRSNIPLDQSLRDVWICCRPDGDGTQAYQRYAAYHIEIAIEPDTGAILRLSFQFDLQSTAVLTRSDIMIEYGPVQIGGKTYDCPLRSVSINRSRNVSVLSEWDESFRSYGPYATMLNDIAFDHYHMFRSESRILPGFTPED